MTQMIVRNTRSLLPGDTVVRLKDNGEPDLRYIRVQDMTAGYITYREEHHLVYFLEGMSAPNGDKEVRMVVTGNVPWCVAREAQEQ